MGGRRQSVSRRLSKPRTNTSSSNLLNYSDSQPLETSSPLASSDMDYFGEHATTVSSQGERRSRRKSRTKLREYLYGSSHESSNTLSSEDDEDKQQNALTGAARGARKRLSRTGSSIMQLSSAMASTNHLSSPSASKLNLGSDPEEAAMVAERIKERAYLDSLAAENHVTSPIDEDKHVDAVPTPLRRKSLYTPGIATRNTSDILRKPPPPKAIQSQADRDYYYNPAYPESSPLARLAALNVSDDGRSTPLNLHVTHLGGLQLGTLRVTNGTASPVPQNRSIPGLCPSPSPTHDEYLTASEGSVNGSKISKTFSASTSADVSDTNCEDPNTPICENSNTPIPYEHTTAYEPRLDETPYLQRQESFPFRQEPSVPASVIANEYISEIDGNPFSSDETSLSKEAALTDEMFDDEAIALPHSQLPEMEMWTELINDVESRHAKGGSQQDALERLTVNTPSILDKRLSVPSTMASRYSTSMDVVPKTDSGYSSNASLYAGHSPKVEDDRTITPQEPMPQHLPMRPRCISGPREMPQADWTRNASCSRTPSPKKQPSFTVLPRNTLANPNPYVSSTGVLETVEPVRPSPPSQSQSFARKLQKVRPKSQPPPMNLNTVQAYRDLAQAHIPRVPSLIATRHAERLTSFPLLEHTFPSSQHVSARDSPAPSQTYAVPIRFPSPANALEAATTNMTIRTVLEGDEDPRRPENLPIYDQNSFVGENPRGRPDIMRSPSWTNFGFGKKNKDLKKLEKKDREAEKRLAKEEKDLEKRLQKDRNSLEKQQKKGETRSSRASSRTRAKSSERRSSQYDSKVTIADFGTVAESLGGSPYDIATSMSRPRSLSRDASSWHPHQMTSQRPRSVVGMDDTAATDFARLRSRDRAQSFGRPTIQAEEIFGSEDGISRRKIRPQSMFFDAPPMPALSAVDLKVHDLEWARSQQGGRSFSATQDPYPEPAQFNDRGGIPGKCVQLKSMSGDAPPVPALPRIQQIEQREHQMAKARPQSMIIDAPPALNRPAPVPTELTETHVQEPVSAEDSIMPTPHKRRAGSKAIPDLWNSGSIEKKTPSNKAIPDLWNSGSLEKKTPKRVTVFSERAPTSDSAIKDETPSTASIDPWEAQRHAWSQRRKSAGEALFRNHWTETSAEVEPTNLPTNQWQEIHPYSSHNDSEPQYPDPAEPLPRPCPSPLIHPQDQPSLTAYQGYQPPPIPRPGPSPLTQPPLRSQTTLLIPRKPTPTNTIPPKPTPSPLSNLTGRYNGGLLYGYEPGIGLGGSAGTRGATTGASRKSVDVSRGFGVDLSDVPVFVSAAGK